MNRDCAVVLSNPVTTLEMTSETAIAVRRGLNGSDEAGAFRRLESRRTYSWLMIRGGYELSNEEAAQVQLRLGSVVVLCEVCITAGS